MSSANELSLRYIEETTYNETPPIGDFREVRFTDESLTGTPLTVTSEELRSDRQTGGQTNTGLEVNGDINFLLSADQCHIDFQEAVMMDTWSIPSVTTELITIDTSAGTIVTLTDLSSSVEVGDLLRISGSTTDVNNTLVYVTSISGTTINYIGSDTMVDEAASMTITEDKEVQIGTERRGFSIEKNFTDLTNKTLLYTGERLGGMSLNFAFGENITGTYSLGGSGYSIPEVPITNSRVIEPAGSDSILNAALNMGFVVVDGEEAPFCIESLGFELNNNLQPQNCIGKLAPSDQVPFAAEIAITMTAFLADSNFDYHKKKLTQEPVEVVFFSQDVDGQGFAYHFYEVQLSFPDAAGEGANSHVMINMEGVARYSQAKGNTMLIKSFQ